MARLVPKIYPNDIAEHIPVGMGFPLRASSPILNYTTKAQVHDNLRNLILTMKGERPMQPEFGSDLYFLLFEQLYDEDLSKAAHKSIKASIRNWMPFVTLGDVSVTTQADTSSILIEVSYSVQGWDVDDTLNITVKV